MKTPKPPKKAKRLAFSIGERAVELFYWRTPGHVQFVGQHDGDVFQGHIWLHHKLCTVFGIGGESCRSLQQTIKEKLGYGQP